jgi:hypothetical protein
MMGIPDDPADQDGSEAARDGVGMVEAAKSVSFTERHEKQPAQHDYAACEGENEIGNIAVHDHASQVSTIHAGVRSGAINIQLWNITRKRGPTGGDRVDTFLATFERDTRRNRK